MPTTRIGHVTFLIIAALVCPSIVAQVKPAYPVCKGVLTVGEIPNSPFTADLISNSWSIMPDGNRQNANLPNGFVARDHKGRVVMRWSWQQGVSIPSAKTLRGWEETICDPRRKTITNMRSDLDFAKGTVRDRSEMKSPKVYLNGTTVLFSYWHNHVAGRDNLGLEAYEDFPAYRYRISKNSNYLEVVNCDELMLQLVDIHRNNRLHIDTEYKLNNIRQVEPEKKLFHVPYIGPISIPPPLMPVPEIYSWPPR